jgi:hypothetical protein
LRKDLEDSPSQHHTARLAVDALHGCIPNEVPQVVIDDDNPFRGIFDDQLKEQPLAAQTILHLAVLGDVAGGGHDVVIAVQLLWNTHEHHVDGSGYAGHRPARCVALVFAGTNAFPHQP